MKEVLDTPPSCTSCCTRNFLPLQPAPVNLPLLSRSATSIGNEETPKHTAPSTLFEAFRHSDPPTPFPLYFAVRPPWPKRRTFRTQQAPKPKHPRKFPWPPLPPPLTKFHLFPKLTPELRLMVWQLAMPRRLAVRVVPRGIPKAPKQDLEADERRQYRLRYGPTSLIDYLPTPLLHICKESRTHALRRFKPFVGSPLGDAPLYFDFEGDAMFFDDKLAWKFMSNKTPDEEVDEVMRLAAEVEAEMAAQGVAEEDLQDIEDDEDYQEDDSGDEDEFGSVLEDGISENEILIENVEVDGLELGSLFEVDGLEALGRRKRKRSNEAEDDLEDISVDEDPRANVSHTRVVGRGPRAALVLRHKKQRMWIEEDSDEFGTVEMDISEEENEGDDSDADMNVSDGTPEEEIREPINWKQALKFLAFGGNTMPNHESLANFTGVQKVIVERTGAFGLTSLMQDHLFKAFQKARGVEDLDQTPAIQFVNKVDSLGWGFVLPRHTCLPGKLGHKVSNT